MSICRDPALAAKILQLVNSSFFGLPRQVTVGARRSSPTSGSRPCGAWCCRPRRCRCSGPPPRRPGWSVDALSGRAVTTATEAARRATPTAAADAFTAGCCPTWGCCCSRPRPRSCSGGKRPELGFDPRRRSGPICSACGGWPRDRRGGGLPPEGPEGPSGAVADGGLATRLAVACAVDRDEGRLSPSAGGGPVGNLSRRLSTISLSLSRVHQGGPNGEPQASAGLSGRMSWPRGGGSGHGGRSRGRLGPCRIRGKPSGAGNSDQKLTLNVPEEKGPSVHNAKVVFVVPSGFAVSGCDQKPRVEVRGVGGQRGPHPGHLHRVGRQTRRPVQLRGPHARPPAITPSRRTRPTATTAPQRWNGPPDSDKPAPVLKVA